MPPGSFWILFGGCGVLAVVALYPLFLWLSSSRQPARVPSSPICRPAVTIIAAARNAAPLVANKIDNFLQLDYPADQLRLIIASDASTDQTRALVEQQNSSRIRLVESTERRGKAFVLNQAVEQVQDELLLFSDVDAMLEPDAVQKLVRHFSDEQLGGVCGLRATGRRQSGLQAAQQSYIDLDSALKKLESARGQITSNDGKIHMIRRSLFRPIPPDVTDDLYTALSVISQGFRFVFDSEAMAQICTPSRNAKHELCRRRRIVIRSLTGIWQMRSLLNPLRHGAFAVGILLNKVGRRLLPFFLFSIVIGLSLLVGQLFVVTVLFAAVFLIGLYGLGTRYSGVSRWSYPVHLVGYLSAGLIGSAWGVVAFLIGQRVCLWEPQKAKERGGA